MKIKSRLSLILFLGFCVSMYLVAQKPADLEGTWVGLGNIEGMDSNELTLVLILKEGELTGHMTGQYGTLNESPVSDVSLEDGIFKFQVLAMGPGGQDIAVTFAMKIDGDSMTGELEIPDMGIVGTWEATKQT